MYIIYIYKCYFSRDIHKAAASNVLSDIAALPGYSSFKMWRASEASLQMKKGQSAQSSFQFNKYYDYANTYCVSTLCLVAGRRQK